MKKCYAASRARTPTAAPETVLLEVPGVDSMGLYNYKTREALIGAETRIGLAMVEYIKKQPQSGRR